MSTEQEEGMRPAQRLELIEAILAIRDLAQEARDNLIEGDDYGALNVLALIEAGITSLHNAIGQYHDRIICPACRKIGKNKPKIRQGAGVIEVGFECEHCQHEWGFGP